jgi:hypothetical protein
MILCLLLAVPASSLAFSDGGYTGKHSGTSFGGKHGMGSLNFSVTTKKVKVKKKRVSRRFVEFYGAFTNIDVKCPNGSLVGEQIGFGKPNGTSTAKFTPIRTHGKFAFSGKTLKSSLTAITGTAQLSFSGRLKGSGKHSHAAGKMQVTAKEHGKTCKSPKVGWTAHKYLAG